MRPSVPLQRPVLQLLVVIILPLAVTALACRGWNIPRGEVKRDRDAFDPPLIARELRQEQTEWVLIGNSMLGSRIADERKLAEAAGMRVKLIEKGGSQSATWFLMLKQIVIASGVKPRCVTVFFRHTDLTWADLRTSGIQAESIAQMDGPAQPEWREVIGDGGGPALVTAVESGLKRVFPSNYLNFEAREWMQTRSLRLTRIGTHANAGERREELNERFSLAHLRHDLGGDIAMAGGAKRGGAGGDDNNEEEEDASYDFGPKTFDPSPRASFLPHMVKLAADNGIKLHFHRVKRRPRGASLQSEWLKRYITDLGSWLEKNGCAFTDETGDSSIDRSMYADGDHLSADAAVQERYRRSFLERVMPVLGAAAVTAEN